MINIAAASDLYKLTELFLIVILAVLILLVFRKLFLLKTEIKEKNKYYRKLEKTVEVQDHIQQKALGAIVSIEESSVRIRDLFSQFIEIMGVPFGLILYKDKATSIINYHVFPESTIKAELISHWMETKAKFEPNSQHNLVGNEHEELEGLPEETLKKEDMNSVFTPIAYQGEIIGGTVFSTERDEFSEQYKTEYKKITDIFAALISYRNIQNEISLSLSEANAVSTFLAKMIVQNDTENLFDSIYDYFREIYPQTTVSILLLNKELNIYVRKGQPLEEQYIIAFAAKTVEDFKQGRLILYFPDRESIQKRNEKLGLPEVANSILIAPLMIYNEIFGYLTFESTKINPFKVNRLSTIIRLVEITSFLLRKNIQFKKEIQKKQDDVEKFRQVLTKQTVELQDRENTIRELADLNSVYSMFQNIKTSVVSIKGFLEIFEKSTKNSMGQEPIFIRNCLYEVEKIEKNIKTADLVRVITDQEYYLSPENYRVAEIIDKLNIQMRQRALHKRLEMEIAFEDESTHICLDRNITETAFLQYFDRVFDYISNGKVQCSGKLSGNSYQIVMKFFPIFDPTQTLAGTSYLSDKFRGEYCSIALTKLLARQNGKLDIEIQYEHGFTINITFPLTKEH